MITCGMSLTSLSSLRAVCESTSSQPDSHRVAGPACQARSPLARPFATDWEAHPYREHEFIERPCIARPRMAGRAVMSKLLPERAAPLTERLVGHDNTACTQEHFDITDTPAAPAVHPQRV